MIIKLTTEQLKFTTIERTNSYSCYVNVKVNDIVLAVNLDYEQLIFEITNFPLFFLTEENNTFNIKDFTEWKESVLMYPKNT